MTDELEKPTEEPTADEPLKDAATSDNQAPEVRAESGTEVTNPKRKPPVKILVGVLCAVVLGLIVILPSILANVLLGSKNYSAALQIAESVPWVSGREEIISECHYGLFSDYLVKNGDYSTGGIPEWKVVGYDNGDIVCTADVNTSESLYASSQVSLVLTIHRGESTADLTGSSKVRVLNQTIEENASGRLNLSSYNYGDEAAWDNYSNTGTAAGTMLQKNGGMLEKIIRNGLQGALAESGTGATLADLGFKNLSD